MILFGFLRRNLAAFQLGHSQRHLFHDIFYPRHFLINVKAHSLLESLNTVGCHNQQKKGCFPYFPEQLGAYFQK
jgi:hypothetical protein